MIKKSGIFSLIGFAAITYAVVWRSEKSVVTNPPLNNNGNHLTRGAPAAASTSNQTPETDFTAWNERRLKQMGEALKNGQDEWRTPIEFYGKVVDQDSNAVEGASIDFDCNDTSPTGTSFYHAQSDTNGNFFINNIAGKLLAVKASKDGYYAYHPNADVFYYAGQNQNFVPDAGNPVIFRLRKKGPGELLFHFHKSFKVPRDGKPILIDLSSGNLTTSGAEILKVEGLTSDNEKKDGWKYDWKCQVSVPSGGLQSYDQQFPFVAPGYGYISEDFFDMTVSRNSQWTYDVKKNYFVKTADGKYARINFEMVAGGDNFCRIDCYFNPSGSPNLEPAN